MKYFTSVAIYCAAAAAVSAQGLFNIAPNDDAVDSMPIEWTAGINIGYDDNLAPGQATETSSGYATAFVGASIVNVNAQTTWDAYARVGYTTYFDDTPAGVSDDVLNANLGFNVSHRVNERLRLSSRNRFTYGLEPEYSYGLSASRQLEEYIHFSTDNSVGYRWTERLATYTGITYSVTDFDDRNSDRSSVGFYNQFRYQASPQTVLTGTYRFSTTDNPNGRDSDNHYFLVGAEHRLSPTSILVVQAGAQLRDVDGGSDGSSPFVEVAYRSRVSEQFNHRLFARYSTEDYDTNGSGGFWDNNETIRVGYAADYTVSQQLVLHGGLNYVNNEFTDHNVGAADTDVNILNAYLGFSYEINQGMFLTGSYNLTDSSSDDITSRDYDRNRYELGLRASF